MGWDFWSYFSIKATNEITVVPPYLWGTYSKTPNECLKLQKVPNSKYVLFFPLQTFQRLKFNLKIRHIKRLKITNNKIEQLRQYSVIS